MTHRFRMAARQAGIAIFLVLSGAHAAVPGDDPALHLPGPGPSFPPMPFASAAANAVVVYRHAGLVDGTGTPARPGMTIVTRGPLIEAVGKDKDIDSARYPGARIVDLAGKFVLPGLIDSHQHLATPPNRLRAEAQMRRDVFGGITAIRDMADDLRAVAEYKRAALMGEIAGPDIYMAALMAGPGFFQDPRTIAVAEGFKPGETPWTQAMTDDSDVVLAVAMARGTGATALKFYDQLSPALMQKLTLEAHRQGLYVWAHAFVPPSRPEAVIDAGVDVVSHSCYLAYQVSKDLPKRYAERNAVAYEAFAQGDNPELARLFHKMVQRHIVLDATLDVYKANTAADVDKAAQSGKPPPRCTIDLAGQITRQALSLGVTVAAGTDSVPDYTTQFPALYDEMRLLHDKAGMSPLAVIVAATATGAAIIGQKDRMGTIEAGKFANLAIFAKNPAADLKNLETILMTVKRGTILERGAYQPVTQQELPD